MKRNKILFLLFIVLVAGLFFAVYQLIKKQPITPPEKPKQPLLVTVQSAGESRSFTQKIEYPASIAGDQEIKVTAKSAGTVQEVNYDLGDKVSANAILVRIDDTGNNLDVGDEGFRSATVQQAQLSVDQYEEILKTARKTRNKLNSAYQTQKKNPSLTKTVSKTQLIAAEGEVEIAEVQLENAKVGLKGGLDNHLITSPISGYIVSKEISVGDSISLGQELYTISKTNKLKIQFFVDQEQLPKITEGMPISVTAGNGNTFNAQVENISPDADATTKRFLVEAFPLEQNQEMLAAGTIVTVSFSVTNEPQQSSGLILPLAAITISQNENYIFIVENNKAKKIPVKIVKIDGEKAEIVADLTGNSKIIVDGNKMISEGEEVNIKN